MLLMTSTVYLQWLPLQEIKHGDIHLQMQWMHLTESTKTIEEVCRTRNS